MKITIGKKKQEALKRMKLLELYPNVIKEFEKDNVVNLSENGGFLYWLNDEQKQIETEFEEQHDALVYHVIHEFTEFGELLTLLYVSDYDKEWEYDFEDLKDGYACAYVKNLSDDTCSELGSICFKKQFGGLVRTA